MCSQFKNLISICVTSWNLLKMFQITGSLHADTTARLCPQQCMHTAFWHSALMHACTPTASDDILFALSNPFPRQSLMSNPAFSIMYIWFAVASPVTRLHFPNSKNYLPVLFIINKSYTQGKLLNVVTFNFID